MIYKLLQEKRKVDALRENRDYSSLFSDDADTAQPTKEQSDNRTALVPKSGRDTTYLKQKLVFPVPVNFMSKMPVLMQSLMSVVG